MPIYTYRHLQPEGMLGIWLITEPEAWFREHLQLTQAELEQINAIWGPGRRVEWLARRHLLHVMSNREERGACLKDEFGKPHLQNSRFQISISHSNHKVAVIAVPGTVGIDIQKLVPKIERLEHKYMRPVESESLSKKHRIEHLHVYWGAKEALYKAYGRRKLDFREHLLVEPFAYDLEHNHFRGKIVKDDFEAEYDLWHEKIGEFILVYALERKPRLP